MVADSGGAGGIGANVVDGRGATVGVVGLAVGSVGAVGAVEVDTPAAPGDMGSWLAVVGGELGGPGIEAEFAVRLSAGRAIASGRCTCWVPADWAPDDRVDSDRAGVGVAVSGDLLAGGGGAALDAVRRLLGRMDAPAEVLAEMAAMALPVRFGLGVDLTGGMPVHRLYLHSRCPKTRAGRYRCWRWRPGEGTSVADYLFHFLPETADGMRPENLVPDALRPAVTEMLGTDRLRQGSGFWLRRSATGLVDQVDLAFPWYPAAGSLPGLAGLIGHFGLADERRAAGTADWRDLPVRHVAVGTGPRAGTAALYVSAPVSGPLPESEAALQRQVRDGAVRLRDTVEEAVYRRLPSLAPPAPEPASGAVPLDRFYSGDADTWRRILGARLHYHHGLFDPATGGDDTGHGGVPADGYGFAAALDRAVTELYPFIPAGGRLYDVGCGWGGPLAMWVRDLGCQALGLTISRDQFRHVAGTGLPVRLGDAELTTPPGYFDCAVLLESLEHIRDKVRLLTVLRLFCGRLVMRVNCQDTAPPGSVFAGTMHMISSARLRELLTATGWRVTHWRDRRPEAMPSVAAWHRRATEVASAGIADPHLDTLVAWTTRVLAAPTAWAAANPLIEVVADPVPW